MSDALRLGLAFAAGFAGMAWLALSMEPHWRQVRGDGVLSRRLAATLRAAGVGGLAASLALCLAVDHPSMAVPVWVMVLGACALAVAMTLAYRPRPLALLVAWARPVSPSPSIERTE